MKTSQADILGYDELLSKYIKMEEQLNDKEEYISCLETRMQSRDATWDATVEEEVRRRVEVRVATIKTELEEGYSEARRQIEEDKVAVAKEKEAVANERNAFDRYMSEKKAKDMLEAAAMQARIVDGAKIQIEKNRDLFLDKFQKAMSLMAQTLLANIKNNPQESESYYNLFIKSTEELKDSTKEEVKKKVEKDVKRQMGKDIQLLKALRVLFGQKSEKWNPTEAEAFDIDFSQFDFSKLEEEVRPTAADMQAFKDARRIIQEYHAKVHLQAYLEQGSQKGHGKHNLKTYENLPIVEGGTFYPDDYEKNPKAYKKIGEEEYIEIVPAPSKYYRRRLKIVVCALIDDPDETPIRSTYVYYKALWKSHYSNELVSEIMVDKYVNHIPWYRQEQIAKQNGLDLNRSTINDIVYKVAFPPDEKEEKGPVGFYLSDLYELYKEKFFRNCRLLAADGSPMPIVNNEKHKTVNFYLVCFRDIETGMPLFLTTLEGSRSKAAIKELLSPWNGEALLCDGYQGYDWVRKELDKIVCRCTTHSRRDMEFAMKQDPTRASIGMRLYQLIFMVEYIISRQGLTGAAVTEMRNKYSLPIWEMLFAWATVIRMECKPRTPMYEACGYIIRHYEDLTAYINIPEMPCHNNDTEREIRQMVMGKKNYLFCENEVGCELAAMMYTFFGQCKKLGVNPAEWLNYALRGLKRLPKDRLAELLPENYVKLAQVA